MATLSVLRNFVTVVEMREIRAAGEHLGRTPSAVSTALKQLENEVGAKLFISGETVRAHVQKASRKLGAQNRTQAVVLAIRAGLIA